MAKKSPNDYLSPEVRRKKSTNLLWIGILSIVMLFGGLTSAYIVSSGDGFWVDITLPDSFWWSTGIIVLSSITINFAVASAKRNRKKIVKVFVGATLVLGIAFMYLQYKGWGQMIKSGNFFVEMIVPPGKYGSHYTLEWKDEEIGFDGSQYYIGDEPMTDEQQMKMRGFAESLANVSLRYGEVNYNIPEYGELRVLLKGKPLILKDSFLYQTFRDSLVVLTYPQRLQLRFMAQNIVKERGDFMMKGNYGEDFKLLYKGEPLEYKDRRLYLNGEELGKGEYAELFRMKNTSSSFIYILTVLHFLHVFGGIVYLIRLMAGAVRERYSSDNYLNVKLGAIYWHFVDALWVYLFLFLTFIH